MAKTQRQPGNVLLITADQWRGDTLGAVGHPCVRTPNLDRLAGEGTLFARHYATASPCGPARASLHTGLYAHNHRSITNGTPLDARHTNWALEVRHAGYDPTLFGYTDTTADPRGLAAGDPRTRTYEGVLPGLTPGLVLPEDPRPWLAWLASAGFEGPLRYPDVYGPAADGAALYDAAHSDTAFLAGRLIEWLRVQHDRPWCVHLSLLRPHPPWVAPAPYDRRYDPAEVPLPRRPATVELAAAVHPFQRHMIDTDLADSYFVDGGTRPMAALTNAEVRRTRATYYGLISEVDDWLGRLFDALRADGQDARTLVVFTTDHGEMLGDHYRFGKRGYADAAFHIPLIVRDPSPEADAGRGRVVEAFTEAVDVAPTLLDWLGLDAPHAWDGSSLLPFLRGEAPTRWRDEAHWALDFRDVATLAAETALALTPDQCAFQAIRGPRFKYVHFTALPPLLFDLETDPAETRNLADDPAHAATALEMARRLLSWRLLHEDRTLANTAATPDGLVHWRGARV